MNEHAPVMIDVAGLALTAAEKKRMKHPLVAGVVLFGRNWADRAQLTALTGQIKAARPDALITVDHEGGRVQRFASDGFTPLPFMRSLGELWQRDALAATDAATALGFVLAAELRACGVDMSLAPVLDLDHGGSTVIGARAFHRDARVAALLAKSVTHGMLLAGMAHCAKHFPGHGFVKADSHVAIPVDKRSLKAILADDALPYRWLASSLTAVMPAHVIYPKVDERPAGFSTRWLQDVLRVQLGFTGAIFSDDLTMQGARQMQGRELRYGEAAVAALQAGVDLVLLCNQSIEAGGAPIDQLLAHLQAAAASGSWQPSADSEQRRLRLLPTQPPLAWDDLMRDARYVRALERLPA
jgi:beta-N-acetylhexosaminidase